MRRITIIALVAGCLGGAALVVGADTSGSSPPLGLPSLSVPADNPQSAEKIALGEKLFNDTRFSTTGKVSCATCHKAEKAFTDSPLRVSEGINQLTGTRNAPTVVNAAYFRTLFWDGRSPSLEDQALHPFLNPVEMALPDHTPILEIVHSDPDYIEAFKKVFGKTGTDVTMREVTMAIAAFERTQIAGDSAFDRWYFKGEHEALTEAQQRGFDLFVNKGRCVSCHLVEQTQALFTDNRFHNVGVGINTMQSDVPALAAEFLKAKATAEEVDRRVLSDKRSSELGRFALSRGFDDLGAFKTPTLRNIAVTAPYMHDGSLATLRDVMVHYNNGGVTKEGDPVNDFLSGGIRPLGLTDVEIDSKTRCVMGEHDYYLDLGEYWSKLFGPHYYSWDHKGVHFVTLNSVLTYDDWTYDRWPSAQQRMLEMAGLDNPNGSPFMVGEKQREWLEKDLAKLSPSTPVVVFSHSPIQKIYKGWNFWTEDADEVQAILAPFDKVTVIYGHVHQIQYNQIGNISFHSVMATAWPWPYPQSYAQAASHLPKLTVPMNRADPFFERDATGWQFIDVGTGRVAMEYNLYNNTNRIIAFNPVTGQPEDSMFQKTANQTPPQEHY